MEKDLRTSKERSGRSRQAILALVTTAALAACSTAGNGNQSSAAKHKHPEAVSAKPHPEKSASPEVAVLNETASKGAKMLATNIFEIYQNTPKKDRIHQHKDGEYSMAVTKPANVIINGWDVELLMGATVKKDADGKLDPENVQNVDIRFLNKGDNSLSAWDGTTGVYYVLHMYRDGDGWQVWQKVDKDGEDNNNKHALDSFFTGDPHGQPGETSPLAPDQLQYYIDTAFKVTNGETSLTDLFAATLPGGNENPASTSLS